LLPTALAQARRMLRITNLESRAGRKVPKRRSVERDGREGCAADDCRANESLTLRLTSYAKKMGLPRQDLSWLTE
jgi:hypothetical protein